MIKYLKKKQLFWSLLDKFSSLMPDYAFKDIPSEIIMEPTNACNLRCPVCPTHFAMKRERGFMDMELLKSAIDEFKDSSRKPQISFNFAGEPLLSKNLPEMIKYAKDKGHKTFVSTNTTLLSEEMAGKFILSGLDSIHVCLDGFNKKAHESYRMGSNFEEVKNNIENFVKKRKYLGRKNPSICLQVLLTSYSENQMDEMIEWGRDIGLDYINFKTISMGSYTNAEMKEKYGYLLPKSDKLKRKTSSIYKTICRNPLRQALVYWNGDLGLCCVDFDNVLKLPNIKNNGFLKTYYSKKVIKLRKLGFRKKTGLCKNCSIGNADNVGFNINLKNDK